MPEENKDAELESTLYLNVAACQLKLGQFEAALEACNKVGKDNQKALFRMGQAHFGLGNLEKATEAFKEALKLSPNDKAILAELKKIQQKEEDNKKKQKDMYAKMFQKK
jgi:tetratricopeptide (TPR) repeat protein